MTGSPKKDLAISIVSAQRKVFQGALNKHKLADVTFIVGKEEKEYEINRTFLALISPVFEAMLFGKMKESEPNSEVMLEHIEPEIFECILKFAYCGNPKISSSNVLRLIRVCDEYQINVLSDVCVEFFRRDLNCDNFCMYFGNAVVLNSTDAMGECIHFLEKSCHGKTPVAELIKTVLVSDGFMEMDLKQMRIFLSTDSLNCDETLLWEAVVRWAEHQSSMNKCDDFKMEENVSIHEQRVALKIFLLKSVKDLIRFGLMDGEYLVKNVEPEKFLDSKELITILCYLFDKSRGCGSFNVNSRLPRSLEYKVEMSSKYNGLSNDFQALSKTDLNDGCGTKKQKRAWIKADLGKICFVDHIKIAPLQQLCDWGPQYLRGSKIESYDVEQEEWKVVFEINADGIRRDEIKTINMKLRTRLIRITRIWTRRHLGIGHLAILAR